MDPTACLKRLLDACMDEERDEAVNAARDLTSWLERGGFLPDVGQGYEGYLVPDWPRCLPAGCEPPCDTGKTEALTEAALKAGVPVVSRPVVDDPTDYKGIPVRFPDTMHTLAVDGICHLARDNAGQPGALYCGVDQYEMDEELDLDGFMCKACLDQFSEESGADMDRVLPH